MRIIVGVKLKPSRKFCQVSLKDIFVVSKRVLKSRRSTYYSPQRRCANKVKATEVQAIPDLEISRHKSKSIYATHIHSENMSHGNGQLLSSRFIGTRAAIDAARTLRRDSTGERGSALGINRVTISAVVSIIRLRDLPVQRPPVGSSFVPLRLPFLPRSP